MFKIFQKFQFNKVNKNSVLIAVAVLAVFVTGVLVLFNYNSGSLLSFLKISPRYSAEVLAKKAVDYLNTSVLQQGTTATMVSFSEESGVVKINLKIGTSDYASYVSKDGKLLFPQAIPLSASTDSPATQNTDPNATATPNVTPDNVAKVANTSLDAYVVSGCPFGLQMQRAMADAIKSVPSLAKYVKVRYIGAVSGNTITAMHGDEEAQENLRQICIREEQPSKYWDYVSCYMKKAAGTAANGMPYGDTKSCQTATGVDSNKLNACVADATRGLAYAKADFDLNAKYSITGSPTLVLNGAVISEEAFGGRSAEGIKNIICSSSSKQPDFCSQKLNTTPASTSFSLTYVPSSSGSSAVASNNNCAPAVQ